MSRKYKQAILVAVFAIVSSTANAGATEAQYHCSGGTQLTAQFSPPGASNGRVELIFATGRRIELPQVLSADGGRYANAEMEFWIKGRSATLTQGNSRESCATK